MSSESSKSSDRSNQDPRSVVRRWEPPASATRPLVTPLSPSVVFRAADADALDAVYEGRAAGFSYAREGHPNAALPAWMEVSTRTRGGRQGADERESLLGAVPVVNALGPLPPTEAQMSTDQAPDPLKQDDPRAAAYGVFRRKPTSAGKIGNVGQRVKVRCSET